MGGIVHRGKCGLGCMPHACKVNELAGRYVVAAMAGDINIGSRWVSLELLRAAYLPLPCLERSKHDMCGVRPRPGSHWHAEERKAAAVHPIHGCPSCDVWLGETPDIGGNMKRNAGESTMGILLRSLVVQKE